VFLYFGPRCLKRGSNIRYPREPLIYLRWIRICHKVVFYGKPIAEKEVVEILKQNKEAVKGGKIQREYFSNQL
jgi:hypothetical protein